MSDEDLVEHRQGHFVGRRANAALVKHCRQAERLQRHGLATRVRAADHECSETAELQVDGHGGCPVEQRMPRLAQDDIAAAGDRCALPPARQLPAGDHQIELARRVDERRESLGVTPGQRRQVAQDPHDLVALGDLRLPQPVGVVDRCERLDEQRLARAGGVVHDAGHASTGRRFQGQHRPAGTLGHEVVLQVLRECGVARDLAESLGELASAFTELAAEATEIG